MKIKAINEKVRSMKLQVPYDGLISIDANGVAEVSEKAAKILVNGTKDWKYADVKENTDKNKKGSEKTPKESTSPAEQPTKPEEEVEETAEEVVEEEKENIDESKLIIEGIKKMSLEEMIATAEDAGYPKEEYQKFIKKDKMMAAYLIKKYNESQKEA